MKETRAGVEDVLCLLTETPQHITAATRDLSDDQLRRRPDKTSWSTNDILAHLRACADVWGESIQAMLLEDDPVLPDLSPRAWLKKTDYLEIPFQESFRGFVDQRRRLLQVLVDLEFADWSRGAKIRERHHTVFSQARRMALHEVTHIEQFAAVVKKV